MKTYLFFVFCLVLAPCLALAQDPDIEANERAAMEEFFRTSEQPGETPGSGAGTPSA